MGQVFEELLRRFSEMSNETSGEHYTPLRSLKEITDELLALERKSEGLLNEVLGL